MRALFAYLRGRLNERSTYVLIGAGVAAASALPPPWSLASMAVALAGALVKDGPVNGNGRNSPGNEP